MPHLLVDITAHGYGHLAQTAPVLHALCQRLPALRITVRSALPEQQLRARLPAACTIIHGRSDFGLCMHDALRVDAGKSLAAYREAHHNWPERIATEARWQAEQGIDAVFCNVAYLPLAAARLRGIPAAAMSSLNWADLFAHFCGSGEDAPRIHAEICTAYGAATAFLRLQPGMPARHLCPEIALPPVAATSPAPRQFVRQRLTIAPDAALLLVGMGGVAFAPNMSQWPERPGWQWRVAAHWSTPQDRPDIQALPEDIRFLDALNGADLLITKPGYGSFAEAAACGLPALSVIREWPEQPWLVDWLRAHGRICEVDAQTFHHGDLAQPIAELLSAERPGTIATNGAERAADWLSEWLAF